jgi:hypothetical protein
MLANHLWSFANTGNVERNDVSQSLFQPFLAYGTKSGTTVNLQSEATANWEADSGEKWTVPINLTLTQITKLGPFPFSVGIGAGGFVESPTGGPEWKLRTSFTLILPSKK